MGRDPPQANPAAPRRPAPAPASLARPWTQDGPRSRGDSTWAVGAP